MATELNNTEPIKPEEHKAMLQNLQGNILKGHGRKYSRCIFVELDKNAEKSLLCNRLGRIATAVVTSAWKQHIESQDFHNYQIPGAIFGNVFLTAKGYEKLGFNQGELKKKLPGSDKYFLEGMTEVHKDLHDPDPKAERTIWEDGYKDGRIDSMILLADNNEELLDRATRKIMTNLREFSEILACERGNVLQKGGRSVEHFGYTDALSQPIFLETDFHKQTNTDQWNPFASLKLVLVSDNLVLGNEENVKDCFGSYLVFRKLEQDVVGFEHGQRNLAEQLELKASKHQQVGAMMMGRFEDGTPLTLLPLTSPPAAIRAHGGSEPDNNFAYEEDPEGRKCPVFAHIRTTNPRTKGREGREQRIARRGIPYGKRASWATFPMEPVGLLFMCFQENIKKQFVHIQQQANEKHDPIIGQASSRADPPKLRLPDHAVRGRALAQEKTITFDTPWVKLRGGEFFFAPSIPFFEDLKNR